LISQAILILPLIFLLAMLMSTPIYMNSHLHIPELAKSPASETEAREAANAEAYYGSQEEEEVVEEEEEDENHWSHLVFCIEDWNYGGKQEKEEDVTEWIHILISLTISIFSNTF
jgi:hypothetical protein